MTVIVAGITRSGLSLTMQMLNAGGYECKGEYPAFEPYQIGDIPWSDCHDSAVKLVDAHHHLPPPGDYKVIRLRRNLKQQAKSFIKFGSCMGFPIDESSKSRIIKSFKDDYKTIDKWVIQQNYVLCLDFEEIIETPITAANKIHNFVGTDLDIDAMANCVIDRDADCHPELLELQLINA